MIANASGASTWLAHKSYMTKSATALAFCSAWGNNFLCEHSKKADVQQLGKKSNWSEVC